MPGNLPAANGIFGFADELGPIKIVHIHDPATGLKSVVAIDNVACGPAIGGVRMATDVSAEEAFRLARAMTFKNAAAGLPHGGAKSVIFADPKMPLAEKERILRAFARAIRDLAEYIPGPDMGTDERCMGWVKDEIGRAVGLPPEIGGIPLDEVGATGFGVSVAVEVAAREIGLALAGAQVAVQGYGSVGRHAARFLAGKGAVLVAASDSRCTLHDPNGLDLDELEKIKAAGHGLDRYRRGKLLARDDIVAIPCDIWIPAARPDVVRSDNVDRLHTRLIAQGANIPITPEAERRLHEKGILSIPDFVANAGGVICAATEYHGGTKAAAFAAIDEKIRSNTEAVLRISKAEHVLPRAAAVSMAERRVRTAMALRRH
jgi:glutamate dehydrogenase/leucine dehydrogenase